MSLLGSCVATAASPPSRVRVSAAGLVRSHAAAVVFLHQQQQQRQEHQQQQRQEHQQQQQRPEGLATVAAPAAAAKRLQRLRKVLAAELPELQLGAEAPQNQQQLLLVQRLQEQQQQLLQRHDGLLFDILFEFACRGAPG